MKRQALVQQKAKQELLDEIKSVKLSLETAHSNFQNTCDPDLIDCYIYEMNAIHLRYKYLLRQIQEIDVEVPQPNKNKLQYTKVR